MTFFWLWSGVAGFCFGNREKKITQRRRVHRGLAEKREPQGKAVLVGSGWVEVEGLF
jgi:hypothetical protein